MEPVAKPIGPNGRFLSTFLTASTGPGCRNGVQTPYALGSCDTFHTHTPLRDTPSHMMRMGMIVIMYACMYL